MKDFKAFSTEDPEVSERFDRVLQAVVEAMESTQIPYLFIGGIASGGLGRPRSTTDIDIFIRPEDREKVLRSLDLAGFETQKTDPVWLYKAFKEDILVDIIFKSKGEVYLDPEMYQRMTTAEFHGKKLRLVSPEDLLIIKVLAHSELTPGHWHDALALLSHAELDWNYLLKRAKKAPRRVLSLLIYAQSNDLFVPNEVVHQLFRDLFGKPDADQGVKRSAERKVSASAHDTAASRRSSSGPDPGIRLVPSKPEESSVKYRLAHLREQLARDTRTGELDLEVLAETTETGVKLLLRGEVMSAECKEAISTIAHERFPDWAIDNQIRILESSQLGWGTHKERIDHR